MCRGSNAPAIDFLEAIISSNNCTELTLLIRPGSLISTGDSLSINGRTLSCTNVLHEIVSETTLEVTNLECFIQKLTFRPRNDVRFPPVLNSMSFSIPEFERKHIISKLCVVFTCTSSSEKRISTLKAIVFEKMTYISYNKRSSISWFLSNLTTIDLKI